jgi:hypothetical protein
MAEWGRKEYSKKWPSRTPVWTWTAVLGSLVFFAGMLTLQYERSWSAAERLYLTDYLKSGAGGQASATASSKYTLLEAVVGKSQRLVDLCEIRKRRLSLPDTFHLRSLRLRKFNNLRH